MKTTKIYLNYLGNDEKVRMTNALSFLRSDDKDSRAMFERIAGEIYGHDRKFGRYWSARIEDMTIIDATKNADNPKRKDVERLRYMVKRNGRKEW